MKMKKYYRPLGAEIPDTETEWNGMRAVRKDGFWNIPNPAGGMRVTDPTTQNKMDLQADATPDSRYLSDEWYAVELPTSPTV